MRQGKDTCQERPGKRRGFGLNFPTLVIVVWFCVFAATLLCFAFGAFRAAAIVGIPGSLLGTILTSIFLAGLYTSLVERDMRQGKGACQDRPWKRRALGLNFPALIAIVWGSTFAATLLCFVFGALLASAVVGILGWALGAILTAIFFADLYAAQGDGP